MAAALADRIDALLPQTQCTKCGFDGCRPYAEAVAGGAAQINRCPPGGAAGIAKLAALLGRSPLPLDPECGIEGPLRVARIESSLCIGCAKCIAACPVDAIIGAPRRMHTVASALCSGCDLCVPACPVDCIVMEPGDRGTTGWTAADAMAARDRFDRRRERLGAERAEHDRRLERHAARAPSAATRGPADALSAPAAADAADPADSRRRALIDAAMRRARERLAAATR
ncbi:MAG TPA: electron transport complex subunit RsxB [Quisquiliibacterium sp.]|nr:electron transport complex subunit RsxB [Quisquiliibacterium sp.]